MRGSKRGEEVQGKLLDFLSYFDYNSAISA